MTRDEAYERVGMNLDDDKKVDEFSARLIIQEIYKGFENRTCNRCKHYNDMKDCKKLPDWDCMLDEPCQWTPPSKNFCCNLWEKRV